MVFAAERQQLMVTLGREHGRVDVAELASRFGVTTETIRRDLTILEQKGLLRRVHGGGIPVERLSVVPDLPDRNDIMSAAKHAIGHCAAHHLPESGAILVDAGSTTARLVEAIPADRELTVVTNALPTALTLVRNPKLTAFVLGGRVRTKSQATVEDWALNELDSLDVDVAFLGSYGVSPSRGFSTPDPSEAAVKRAMIKSAKRSIVLADHTKLDQAHLSVFASFDNVDLLVTDADAPPAFVDRLRAAGLRVELSTSYPGGHNVSAETIAGETR